MQEEIILIARILRASNPYTCHIIRHIYNIILGITIS